MTVVSCLGFCLNAQLRRYGNRLNWAPHSTAMAGYRVVVASRVPRLAKLVQRQLPAVTVEELDYNVESN